MRPYELWSWRTAQTKSLVDRYIHIFAAQKRFKT
jgi:hypothetical protein